MPHFAEFNLLHTVEMMCTADGGKAMRISPQPFQKWYEAMRNLPAVQAHLESRPQPGSAGFGREGSIFSKYADPIARK